MIIYGAENLGYLAFLVNGSGMITRSQMDFGTILAHVGHLWHILKQILAIIRSKSKSYKNPITIHVFLNDF